MNKYAAVFLLVSLRHILITWLFFFKINAVTDVAYIPPRIHTKLQQRHLRQNLIEVLRY